ncbi:MAG: sensor histidine kinase [Putridiphycobacter sp.]
MLKNRLKNPIFIFYLLVFYVFAQFTWWWLLIFRLNRSIYSDVEFFEKKIWMIIGEGLVFLILLIIGIVAVRNAFKRQQKLTKEEARLSVDQENFVLSVSHELKTPIASVQLFLQTLQKHKQLPTEKIDDIYAKALSEVKRLDEIVNNILLTKQIDKNDFPVNKRPLDLKPFVQHKIEIYQQITCKNHVLRSDIEDVKANVDETAMDSILTNLVENAVKYSPKNSEIIIQLKDSGEHFVLSVSDQGKGIDEDNKKLIFKKFFREQNELTRQTKGTGLGLYIVSFLVEKHNGKISLKDNQPKGLIIEIEIPKK